MAFKTFILICTTLLGLGSATPAFAEERTRIESNTIPNAEDLIKHCWDISEEKRATPSTGTMLDGHIDTALCLEKEIINHASHLIYEGFYSRGKIESEIRLIGKTLGNFYSAMYNENHACTPSCGTIRYTWHMSIVSKLYEQMLTDVIALRKEHGV